MRRHRPLTLLILLALLAAACQPSGPVRLPTASPGASPGRPDPTTGPGEPTRPTGLPALITATVKVKMLRKDDQGRLLHIGSGSGTILTRDGLILTNAHVAAPDAPGLAVQYGGLGPSQGIDGMVVAMTEAEDRPPVDRYVASVVAVDGYLDLAVIRITATIEGQQVTPASLDLPTVPIGDSDAIHINEPLTVIGFPGIGGDTVSADVGTISGFVDDPKIGTRGWIKTSAVVYHGNSGGLAANASGQIVGVPTRIPDFGDAEDVGGFQLVRPINLAKPVIDAARSGQEYGPSRFVKPETGQEQMRFTGWTDASGAACGQEGRVTGYGPDTTALRATFSFAGMTEGLDIATVWVRGLDTQKPVILSRSSDTWQFGPSGACYALTLTSRRPLEEGNYSLRIFGGPSMRLLGAGDVAIGQEQHGPGPGPGPGDRLTGRIVDSDTGLGIAGAVVFILQPGTDVDAWRASP
ncbi:MAG TPA: serine protease, partial [Candidatus Limnocylindrales bacterium]|nr:serine protease [Candidatus Limnocylindrales bacterium]